MKNLVLLALVCFFQSVYAVTESTQWYNADGRQDNYSYQKGQSEVWGLEDLQWIAANQAKQTALEKSCPRGGSCSVPYGNAEQIYPNVVSSSCFDGCQCPPCFTLVGFKLSKSSKQHWRCVQYKPNPRIPCNLTVATAGSAGFCQANSSFELPNCRIPTCAFDNKGIYGDGNSGLALNWAPDGFFILDIAALDQECFRSCELGCYDGQARCIRRTPYNLFE